ncbi:hypothetical protein ACA910_002266 [Epithemia clementina (nom. ined.)]
MNNHRRYPRLVVEEEDDDDDSGIEDADVNTPISRSDPAVVVLDGARLSTSAALERLRRHALRAIRSTSSNSSRPVSDASNSPVEMSSMSTLSPPRIRLSSSPLYHSSNPSSSAILSPWAPSSPQSLSWPLFSRNRAARAMSSSSTTTGSSDNSPSDALEPSRESAVVSPLTTPSSPLPRFLTRNLRAASQAISSPSSSSLGSGSSTDAVAPAPPPALVSSSPERFCRSQGRARIGHAVRSIARLAALHQAKRYDTTLPVLQGLAQLEQWTDDADHWREDLVVAGGIRLLLDLLTGFGTQADVLVKVCNIITYMARNGSCLRALSAQATIAGVLQAMQRHVPHALLQARACNALNNLAMREENRIRIAQAKGIPQILKGMEEHLTNAEVQANGCNCLWNLAIWPPNRPLIAQANGVVRILRAMETHVDDPALFGEGCGALWNLADHPPTRNQILQHNSIATICEAMEKHRNHYIMHRLCCGALESLLNDNDLGRVLLYQQGDKGMPLVLAAMRRRPQDEELQSAGCGIVANYALGDLMHLAVSSFVSSLHDLGAPSLLMTAMQRHPSSTKVQGRACSAMSYLSYNATARQALVDAGAVHLVQDALLEHAGDTVVFGTAVLALHQLTNVEDDKKSDDSVDESSKVLLTRQDRAPAA